MAAVSSPSSKTMAVVPPAAISSLILGGSVTWSLVDQVHRQVPGTISTPWFNITPFMMQTGALLMSAHLALMVFFRQLPSPYSQNASFLAHHTISMLMFIWFAYLAVPEWLSLSTPPTPEARVWTPNAVSSTLNEFTFAQFIFWDIWVTAFTPALHNPIMVFHHILLLVMSSFGLPEVNMFGYFGVFYTGLMEISSIPLMVVSSFKPGILHELLERHPRVCKPLNEVCRISFAILFLVLRNIYMTYMSLRFVIPDCLHVLYTDSSLTLLNKARLHFTWFSNLSFTLMQFYWGNIILKQLVRAVCGTSNGVKHEGSQNGGDVAKAKRL